ncbi:MAG: hypothetical protein LBN74_07615 [Prevotella sp.]|jgi:hypothetical protein|nr:hypothetical protein [Prevotella sp.]
MAILDNIFNDNKNSFYPTNDQDLEEEATNMPEIPVTKASDQDNKQPAEIIQKDVTAFPVQPYATHTHPTAAAAPQPPAKNKWGYTESDMDTLLRGGVTPEKLEYYSNFDPLKHGNFYQYIYGSSVAKPTAPDQEHINRVKLMGTIGDSLGLLAQMWSAGKGAHIKERDYKNSASAQIADKEKDLKKLYLQQQDKYNAGMYNAKVNDIKKALNDYADWRKNIQGLLAAKQKQDLAQAKQEFDIAYKTAILQGKSEQQALNEAKQKETAKLNQLKFEEQKRHAKRMEGIQGMNAQTGRMRANADIEYKKNGGGKGASGKIIPFFFQDGTNVNVPEAVWKANYPVLIDILTDKGVRTPGSWDSKPPTAPQAEYFIKQNKDKLPQEAKDWLKEISQMNPAEYGDISGDDGLPAGFDMNNAVGGALGGSVGSYGTPVEDEEDEYKIR